MRHRLRNFDPQGFLHPEGRTRRGRPALADWARQDGISTTLLAFVKSKVAFVCIEQLKVLLLAHEIFAINVRKV